MTTDQAATLLATYELTGSVRQTAKRLGVHPSTVSRQLKAAGVPAYNLEPAPMAATKGNVAGHERPDWAAAWGQREQRGLEIADQLMESPDVPAWDKLRFVGIAADKRYREEHPESVRGGGWDPAVIVPVQIVVKSDKHV